MNNAETVELKAVIADQVEIPISIRLCGTSIVSVYDDLTLEQQGEGSLIEWQFPAGDEEANPTGLDFCVTLRLIGTDTFEVLGSADMFEEHKVVCNKSGVKDAIEECRLWVNARYEDYLSDPRD